MEQPCPFCRGKGRVHPNGLDREVWPEGFVCDACNGTGDYETVKLLRAYRLGRCHERAAIVAKLAGQEPCDVELGWQTIQRAVTDDVARLKQEDALRG